MLQNSRGVAIWFIWNLHLPEAKTNSGESASAEEEQKAPAAAPLGEETGDAEDKSAENAPEDGKTGEDGETAEGEKSEKSGAEEQGKKKKKKDGAKKAEWVTESKRARECFLNALHYCRVALWWSANVNALQLLHYYSVV